MKKHTLVYVLLFCLLANPSKAQTCSCRSLNNYQVEYPSTGNVQPSASNNFGGVPNPIPQSDLTNGKSIHIWFPTGPCNNTIQLPCDGKYTATVNGQTFQTIGNLSNSNLHLQIPTNALVTGSNTIVIKGICQTNVNCAMNNLIVNVVAPGQPTQVTLSSECCTVTKYWNTGDPSNPHASKTEFSGQIKFKINGIPNGCVLKVISGVQSSISYETILDNSYTNCYSSPIKFSVVDAVTKLPVPGATVNNKTVFTYIKNSMSCKNISINPTGPPILINKN